MTSRAAHEPVAKLLHGSRPEPNDGFRRAFVHDVVTAEEVNESLGSRSSQQEGKVSQVSVEGPSHRIVALVIRTL